ncbi:MAG: DNA primase large subunit PriL [Nitrososphaerota archaeon]
MASIKGLSITARYPFLPEARRRLAEYGITLESFNDPAYLKVVERAKRRILEAIERGDEIELSGLSDDDFIELASFPLSIAMIAAMGDKRLARRFALATASLTIKLLESEDPEWRDEIVLKIARDVFSMDVRQDARVIGGVSYGYSLGLRDYLRGALAFNRPEWKLVNRVVERGRVLVTSHELIRLLKDRVMEHVLSLIERVGKIGALPGPVEEAIKEIRGKMPAAVELELDAVKTGPETWPPCMRAIADKLMAGENISHFANFSFAAFLSNIGFEPHEIIRFYANRPDFNERIARYQVEHIAGLRGSRTRYTAPSCSTMKTNGLCVKDGALCGGVRSPLAYYRRAIRRMKKLDKDKDEVGEERGEAGGEAIRGSGADGDNAGHQQVSDNLG